MAFYVPFESLTSNTADVNNNNSATWIYLYLFIMQNTILLQTYVVTEDIFLYPVPLIWKWTQQSSSQSGGILTHSSTMTTSALALHIWYGLGLEVAVHWDRRMHHKNVFLLLLLTSKRGFQLLCYQQCSSLRVEVPLDTVSFLLTPMWLLASAQMFLQHITDNWLLHVRHTGATLTAGYTSKPT